MHARFELVAYSPAIYRIPRQTPLPLFGTPQIDVGWLIDATALGKVPRPGRVTAHEAAVTALRLELIASTLVAFFGCTPLRATTISRRPNDELVIATGGVAIIDLSQAVTLPWRVAGPKTLRALIPLSLRLVVSPATRLKICRR